GSKLNLRPIAPRAVSNSATAIPDLSDTTVTRDAFVLRFTDRRSAAGTGYWEMTPALFLFGCLFNGFQRCLHVPFVLVETVSDDAVLTLRCLRDRVAQPRRTGTHDGAVAQDGAPGYVVGSQLIPPGGGGVLRVSYRPRKADTLLGLYHHRDTGPLAAPPNLATAESR